MRIVCEQNGIVQRGQRRGAMAIEMGGVGWHTGELIVSQISDAAHVQSQNGRVIQISSGITKQELNKCV